MISTNGITMQFGAKPLFENVSVKFGEGNRYGLIGANGSGKSTFMKILGGDLEQTAGEVAIENGVRLGKLRQDQFAYEDMRVLDVVMMGHTEMWAAMTERDAIYANLEATEDDYMKAAELEAKFAEYDGYTAEARAAELLSGVGISEDLHNATMAEVAPGFKLRVLLAQALFSKPDVLLLDEPTNNLDINTIRWLEGVLNQYDSTMIIISHDRHFLNEVCTHMADLDYNTITIYPGNYDDLDGSGTLSEGDRTFCGKANPTFTLGWNNQLSWRNWDVNLFFTGAFGAKRLNLMRYFAASMNGASKFITLKEAYYQSFGKTDKPIYPAVNVTNNNYQGASTKWLEKADYFRLDNITLSYNLTKQQTRFADVKLSLSCQNVFTLTGYKGLDPSGTSFMDTSLGNVDINDGIDMGAYPLSRTFTFGVKINF